MQVFVLRIVCCCCFLSPCPPPKVIGFYRVWLNAELTVTNQEAREARKREDQAKMCKNQLLTATGQRTVSPEFCGASGC